MKTLNIFQILIWIGNQKFEAEGYTFNFYIMKACVLSSTFPSLTVLFKSVPTPPLPHPSLTRLPSVMHPWFPEGKEGETTSSGSHPHVPLLPIFFRDWGFWTLPLPYLTLPYDALMMQWWCTDDAVMMQWWCAEYALMMHWWCAVDALMMHL